VNFLWKAGHVKVFWPSLRRESIRRAMWTRLSSRASLEYGRRARTIRRVPNTNVKNNPPVNTAVHRFQESIAGHPYLIEVIAVAQDRWRAYIVRIPGVPTALMPFYGPTPHDAAHQLCEWLTRAHERASSNATRV
jgi:hypothetical protein